MEISYDPKRSSSKNVAHLVASDNKFIAPTTFPNVHNYDQVVLRYSAKGSHSGEFYQNIQPSGRKAKWTAAPLFKLNNQGKITLFIKEWDKLSMWKQLGFPFEEATHIPTS